VDPRGDARVRREDGLPTRWLVAGSFDGWGGMHETHLGLGNACRFFTFNAPSCNAFVAAVKEVLWHADSGYARADELRLRHSWPVLVLLGHSKFDA